MKEFDFPIAPFVLGLVLGPLLEKSLVQTSALGQGNFMIMFQSPISVGILLLALLLAIGPAVLSRFQTTSSKQKDLTNA